MDLRQLRYFVTIVECGSLSEASRRLHIAQPALSQRLAALESDLGVQLLVRGRLGVAVTEAGAELHTRALAIIKQFSAARDAVRQVAGTASGPVAVGLLRTLAPALGTALFHAIRQELPQVIPEIAVGYSAELLSRLRASRLDITMLVQGPHLAGLEISPLHTERFCLVGVKAFMPAHDGHRVGLASLRDVPLLLSAMQPSYNALVKAAEQAGTTLSIIGGVEHVASVFALCAAGVAATIVPESGAVEAAAAHGLDILVIDEPGLLRETVLASLPGVTKTAAVVAVEAILARLVAERVTLT